MVVLSESSLGGSSSNAMVLKARSTMTNQSYAEPDRWTSHNKAHPRQYTRKDDAPPPRSPTSMSEVVDADSSGSSFDVDPNGTNDTDDEEEWNSDDMMFEKRVFDSPRLITEDDEIFCAPETHSLYKESK